MKDKGLDKLNSIISLILTPFVIATFIILRFFFQAGYIIRFPIFDHAILLSVGLI